MSNLQQPIVIIAGMHRSGTSLIASLLRSAGINLGQRLLEGDPGNVKGYFENLDFLTFHQNLLTDLGINKVGWTLQEEIVIPEAYISQAQELVEKSAASTQPWGWKDPRTTLLLDFWANLLPSAKFVFVYRAPWEVLDSLYRRGDEFFRANPELALKMWWIYNQKILNFYHRFPDKCLLLNLNQVTANSKGFIEAIGKKWGIPLISPDDQIYDRSLLHRQTSKSHYPTIIKDYFPETFELYTQLNQITGNQELFGDELAPSNSLGVFLLQEWSNVRTLEQEQKQSTGEIENLQQAKNWLESQYQLWKQEAEKIQQSWEESQKWIKELEQSKDWLAAQSQQWEEKVQEADQAWQKSQDWIKKLDTDIDGFNQQINFLQKTLEDTRQELEKAQQHIQHLQQQQQQTYQELEKAQGHIQHLDQQQQQAYQEIKKAQGHIQHLDQLIHELQQQKASLESEKAELEVQTHLWQQKNQEKAEELEQIKTLIEAMENSKFWKLRNTWFKLKQTVQSN